MLYYKHKINTTIPQTNIISTIKQLINAVSQFLQMCRNLRQRERGDKINLTDCLYSNKLRDQRQTDRQTDRQ